MSSYPPHPPTLFSFCKSSLCDGSVRISVVSVAVVECVRALAERHPAAFITKFIPTLKEELFSGEQICNTDRNSSCLDSYSPHLKQIYLSIHPDQTETSELHSHHAVRQRCLSALAAVSVRSSVVQTSAPVLLEVLSSAHRGILLPDAFSPRCRGEMSR